MKRRLLAGIAVAALALGGAVTSAPAQARPYIGVSIGVAPPPPRFERVGVRPGYVWAPGYWRWNGGRHVWASGYWVPGRPGYRYRPAAWVQSGPAWRFRGGYWYR